MFKTTCCGGTPDRSVVEMEKQDKEPQEKQQKQEIIMEAAAATTISSSATNYKLTYFNARIGGEMIRLMFHKAGVPFEDNRIVGSDWPSLKSDLKWGKLPVLDFEGHKIYSSTAISRLLAKRFSLAGKNEIEAAKCDELVEVCQDLRTVWGTYYFGNENLKEENKANFLNLLSTYLPKYEETIEKNGGSWFVGDGCTWADLFVANFFDVCEDSVDSKILDGYPALKKMKAEVFAFPEIKQYVENRPSNSY